MVTAAVVTLIEIGGLLLVIAVAKDSLLTLPTQWPNLVPAINQVNSLAIIMRMHPGVLCIYWL